MLPSRTHDMCTDFHYSVLARNRTLPRYSLLRMQAEGFRWEGKASVARGREQAAPAGLSIERCSGTLWCTLGSTACPSPSCLPTRPRVRANSPGCFLCFVLCGCVVRLEVVYFEVCHYNCMRMFLMRRDFFFCGVYRLFRDAPRSICLSFSVFSRLPAKAENLLVERLYFVYVYKSREFFPPHNTLF